ncbi:hypothetical protein RQP46_002243 [Phenoliferia psychrophenolica]
MPGLTSPVATVHFAVPPSRLGHSADVYMDPLVGPTWPQEPVELEKTGFALLRHESKAMGPLRDSEAWNDEYLEETSGVLKDLLGATKVLIWNSVSRSSDPQVNTPYGASHFQKEPVKGLQFGATIRGTAAGAHVDQDADNSRRMCRAAAGDDVFEKYRRVQQINFWRPISGPVTQAPLVVCDGRTVGVGDKSTHCGMFGTRVVVHHGDGQKWSYLSRQQPDEAFLLKIYDSEVRDGDAAYVPHTGANIHGHNGEETPRESIEVRVVVLYE